MLENAKCHAIIHTASLAAAAVGGGLANIPCSDAPILTAIQTGMIVALGKVFDVTVSQSLAKTMLADTIGSFAGKTFANVLTCWIPGVGNVVNGTTAAGFTEAIGWIVAHEFEEEY